MTDGQYIVLLPDPSVQSRLGGMWHDFRKPFSVTILGRCDRLGAENLALNTMIERSGWRKGQLPLVARIIEPSDVRKVFHCLHDIDGNQAMVWVSSNGPASRRDLSELNGEVIVLEALDLFVDMKVWMRDHGSGEFV